MADLSLHNLDKRVSSLEEWKDTMQAIDLPSIREAIKNEIPNHYTKRISESESNTMLRIESLIDKKLTSKFGWIPRIIEGLAQAIIIILAIKVLGL